MLLMIFCKSSNLASSLYSRFNNILVYVSMVPTKTAKAKEIKTNPINCRFTFFCNNRIRLITCLMKWDIKKPTTTYRLMRKMNCWSNRLYVKAKKVLMPVNKVQPNPWKSQYFGILFSLFNIPYQNYQKGTIKILFFLLKAFWCG